MKNITFKEQINQFLKNKTKGNPCYVYAWIRLRKRLSACVRRLDLAHT